MHWIYFIFYNFIRIHETLDTAPAVAASLEELPWSLEDIVRLIDERELKRRRANDNKVSPKSNGKATRR